MTALLDFLQLIIGFAWFWFGVAATAASTLIAAIKMPYRALAVSGVLFSTLIIGTLTMGIAHGILLYSHPSATDGIIAFFLNAIIAISMIIALSKPAIPRQFQEST